MTRTSFGAQHIESKITNLIKPLFSGNKQNFLIIGNITKNWEKIVGKKYAKLCYPKSISFDKNDSKIKRAKLTIGVFNSSAGFFLQNNSEILLEKIAILYGFKAVHKIIIKQENKEIESSEREEKKLLESQEKELQDSLRNIKDKDLSQTLARLGRDILGSK